MIKSLIARFFGGSSSAEVDAGGVGPVAFVDYVVKSLVEHPGEVFVESQDDDRGTLIKVSCRKDEIGRVIGKRGKTIDAIRALVKASAARNDQKVSVVVLED